MRDHVRVAALLTCHNRREFTIDAVARLHSQLREHADIDVLILDAGSTDGTADALEQRFGDIELLRRDADVFWNGGMYEVFRRAAERRYDFYLWLNDDTFLDDDALRHLLDTHRAVTAAEPGTPALVAGATRDPDTGRTSYGGVRRVSRLRPLRFELVDAADTPRQVDTMNGNVVLIPHAVVERIGVLDDTFSHGLGDFDYGLRARAGGCTVWVAAGTVGTCRRAGPGVGRRPFREQVRTLRGPKGLPPREWLTFAHRWGGPAWPLYGVSPYMRRLVSSLATTMSQILRR
jgi:GT2 family glycosyltransferase